MAQEKLENQNRNPNRVYDAPDSVQEMHEATHRRLFRNDVARKVDEILDHKKIEERSWRAAEAEAADFAAKMDEIAANMARDKERESVLRSKLREMTRIQDRIDRETSDLQASMGRIKLSSPGGASRVSKVEARLGELLVEHECQAKEITATKAQLEAFRAHVEAGGNCLFEEDSVLQGLDKDAKLVFGIDQKHQVMNSRKRILDRACMDIEAAVKKQEERHGEQSNQLAVADMTLKALLSFT